MNDPLAQAPSPPPMWLPAQALGCYEGDARLRSWLLEPGLLTARMRSLAGAAFRLNVVREGPDGGGHRREIELLAGEAVWLYAETRVPAATLLRHPWLAELQGRALGEALAARSDVRRSPLEFARESADATLVARALERARLEPQPLWVRRTRYAVAEAPFALQELFLPGIGVLD